MNPQVAAATHRAAVFLRVQHESQQARTDALDQAAGLLLSAMLQFVLAGRDDLATRAHRLLLESYE